MKDDIKARLSSERNFIEMQERDTLLDKIINNFDFLDICYVYSSVASNSVYFQDDNKATIIWDDYYWECYRTYLHAAISYQSDTPARTQNVIGEMARFISNKYHSILTISSFVQQIYDQFRMPDKCTPLQEEFIDILIKIGKVFSLFHEIGHIYYKMKRFETTMKKDYVIKMFSALDEGAFDSIDKWSKFSWNSVTKILAGNKEDILEEIVCDAYSSEEIVHIIYSIENLTPFNSAKAIVIATENLLNFQSMFNAICAAWNHHYAELKYGLSLKSYKPDDEINELAILRNQLGVMINTSLVCRLFSLSKEERENVWIDQEAYHIDNERVVQCFADDDFIRQTIEDSRMP